MDSNRSLTKKLVGSKSKRGKGNRRLFDSKQLTILNTSFSEDPYPDFATRRKLANLIHCSIDVISNWFQNKRARLPAKARRKIFEAHKSQNNALENSSLQATPREPPHCVSEQSISYTQETVLGDNPSVNTQEDPSQQVSSVFSGIPNIDKLSNHALEFQANTGSELSPYSVTPNSKSGTGVQSSMSSVPFENCFDKKGAETWQSHQGNPYLPYDDYSLFGENQQQNNPYSLFQGHQQQRQHQLQEPPWPLQPDPHQEKQSLLEELEVYLNPKLPPLQSQLQDFYPQIKSPGVYLQDGSSLPCAPWTPYTQSLWVRTDSRAVLNNNNNPQMMGESLCSQPQQAPSQTTTQSPLNLMQDVQDRALSNNNNPQMMGESLCSQSQQAPSQTATMSPLNLMQDMQDGAPKQPML